MVPTSDRRGGSISFFRGGGGLATTGSATTAGGGGGRRDGEKTGRSRVSDNRLSGTPHIGLGLNVRAGVAGGGTTRPVVTGSAGSEATGLANRVSPRMPASSASPGNAV